MLEFLRQKAQSTVIQVIIVVIILVFIFWGVGSNQGNGINAVATVNDTPITYTEYQRAYDTRFNQLRDQLGGNIPDGLIQTLDLKNQVLEGLIQRTLVSQAAAETGLIVSDAEVAAKIQAMEAFKNEGAFDVGWYKQILAGNRTNPVDFEMSMKSDLLVGKIMNHLALFGGVADSELRDRFNYDYQEKQFSYLAFEPASFEEKIVIEESALADYFQEHQEEYRGEPQYKLKYVLFPFAESEIGEMPEESIISYYDQHRDEYVVPEQRKASHILIMIDENDSEDVITEKRLKAEDLLKQARDGKNFAELAKKYSDDKGSAVNGGDLGFFGRGQMVQPFEDGVFGLAEGGLTIARSDFGFHVIKLAEVKPLQVRPIAEVRDSIIAKIKVDELKNQAFKAANGAYEQIIMSGSLDRYAESGGKLQETGYFTQQKLVEPIKSNPRLREMALALKQGELSSLLEGNDSYAIFYAEEIKEPEVPELAKVRKEVAEDFVQYRARLLAEETAQNLLTSLRAGATLNDEANRLGSKIMESPLISRVDQAKSKLPAPLVDAAMNLSEAAPYPDEVITAGQTFYVAAFKDEKIASPVMFEEKKEEITNSLVAENKNTILNSWVAYLRDQAEIQIDSQF